MVIGNNIRLIEKKTLEAELDRRLLEWKRQSKEQCCWVAYSGGLDSSVLLALLHRYHMQGEIGELKVCHINHQLSGAAYQWEEHCHNVCKHYELPLLVHRIQLSNYQPQGLEGAAREARYAYFSRLMKPGSCLLTGHHQEDQVEQFFLALKRGSGPRGLSGMVSKRPLGRGYLYRPLLNVPQSYLLEYANALGLCWIEDESNAELKFDRNFIRHKVLPLLSERWPTIRVHIARSMTHCREEDSLLTSWLHEELERYLNPAQGLSIAGLRGCSTAKRQALLRTWCIAGGTLPPGLRILDKIWHEVAHSREDKCPELYFSKHRVWRFRGRLYLSPVKEYKSCSIPWNLKTVIALPYELGQLEACIAPQGRCKPPERGSMVRVSLESASLHDAIATTRHRLKHFFQTKGIPPWMRRVWPVLKYGGQPVTLIGTPFVHPTFCSEPGEEGLRIIWSKAPFGMTGPDFHPLHHGHANTKAI